MVTATQHSIVYIPHLSRDVAMCCTAACTCTRKHPTKVKHSQLRKGNELRRQNAGLPYWLSKLLRDAAETGTTCSTVDTQLHDYQMHDRRVVRFVAFLRCRSRWSSISGVARAWITKIQQDKSRLRKLHSQRLSSKVPIGQKTWSNLQSCAHLHAIRKLSDPKTCLLYSARRPHDGFCWVAGMPL